MLIFFGEIRQPASSCAASRKQDIAMTPEIRAKTRIRLQRKRVIFQPDRPDCSSVAMKDLDSDNNTRIMLTPCHGIGQHQKIKQSNRASIDQAPGTDDCS
jgi:hypothetical protein